MCCETEEVIAMHPGLARSGVLRLSRQHQQYCWSSHVTRSGDQERAVDEGDGTEAQLLPSQAGTSEHMGRWGLAGRDGIATHFTDICLKMDIKTGKQQRIILVTSGELSLYAHILL